MIHGINAGFGEPIGAADLSVLKSRGLWHVRQALLKAPAADHQPGETPAVDPKAVTRLKREMVRANMTALWIATEASLPHAPVGSHVELLNEPNLHGWTPCAYAQLIHRCQVVAQARRLTMWVGSVSNTGAEGQAWLGAVLAHAPLATHVAVHRYPTKNMRPSDAQKGFRTRGDETRALTRLIGSRPWMVTEVGYHTAAFQPGWWPWRRRRLSDVSVAQAAAFELAWWADAGAEAVYWYQFQDGPTDEALGRYGIRTFDKVLKPVAEVFGA